MTDKNFSYVTMSEPDYSDGLGFGRVTLTIHGDQLEKDMRLKDLNCTNAFAGNITLSVGDMSQGGQTADFTFDLEIAKPESIDLCQTEESKTIAYEIQT